MTSNEERREIARKLRDIKCVDLGDGLVCPSCDLGEALDFDWANDDYIFEATVNKLADLIDRPKCHDAEDEHSKAFTCSACGFSDSKLIFNPFTIDLIKLKPDFHYCPNCGAEVQE